MAEIIWTSEASRWLKDIFDYIAQDDQNAAKKVVDGIYTKVQLIKIHPEIGYKYEHDSCENVRILLYGHYRIAYFVASSADIMEPLINSE